MNRQSLNNNRKVRWRWLLRWKNALNHDYKNNNGRNFQFTKFSFIDFVLTDRRSLSGKRPKSASDKSSSCRFSFSAVRKLTQTPLNTQLSVFLLVYWFPSLPGKFEPDCLSAIRIFWCFSHHNSRKSRETTCKSWRLRRSFINLTEWRQRRVTCKQLIGFINTRYFFTCVVTAFLKAGNPSITPQFMW